MTIEKGKAMPNKPIKIYQWEKGGRTFVPVKVTVKQILTPLPDGVVLLAGMVNTKPEIPIKTKGRKPLGAFTLSKPIRRRLNAEDIPLNNELF